VRGIRCPKGGDLDNQPGEYLTAIWGDKNNVWATGAGPNYRIVRLELDGRWVEEAQAYYPLAALREGWAVGNVGTILRRDANGWNEITESIVAATTSLLAGPDAPIAAVGQAQS
jgi:hypothetical protein